MEKDRLDIIFEKQKVLQARLGTVYDQQFINMMCLAMHCETTELLESTKWKPWSKSKQEDLKNYKYELADLVHFLVNLCLAKGITADELFDEYMKKNKENHERQDNNY